MHGKTRRDAFGRRELLVLSALGLVAGAPRTAFAGSPQGQLTWAVHFSLAPTWFDPAETPGMITPFLLMYALHDAMVKPMPSGPNEPCLAEGWKAANPRKQLPFVFQQRITDAANGILAEDALIADRNAERERVNSRFDADARRLRELLGNPAASQQRARSPSG